MNDAQQDELPTTVPRKKKKKRRAKIKLFENELLLFQRSPSISASLDAKVGHILIVIFITVTLHLVDRQTEYITRVDYTLALHVNFYACENIKQMVDCKFTKVFVVFFSFRRNRWKQQLEKKQEEAECTKDTIKILVHNILPAHVGKPVSKESFA